MSQITLPRRNGYQGALNILRFNRAKYIGSLVMLGVGFGLLQFGLPPYVRYCLWTGMILTGYWSVASLFVSHWVYDRSELYGWRWLKRILQPAPFCWVNIHAGLDESSHILREIFPAADSLILDIYDPSQMTEPAIVIARGQTASDCIAADYQKLPLKDDSVDVVFLLFAAHELRQSLAREQFFKELNRILIPRGKLVLVEHLRDWKNFAAFGPGAFHFYSRDEWLRLACSNLFATRMNFSLTPFVRAFVFEKI
jgi:SAM-dependent methyltransferase